MILSPLMISNNISAPTLHFEYLWTNFSIVVHYFISLWPLLVLHVGKHGLLGDLGTSMYQTLHLKSQTLNVRPVTATSAAYERSRPLG
jgi:hypothetical protein